MTRDEAERYTILRCLVGSTAHGVNVDDGLEDRDEMGIVIEPLEHAWTVGAVFEQFIYRTAAEREGKHDAKSYAGDLDLTLYSLRKWLRLALKGNPTVLLPLFATPITSTPRGRQLQCLAPYIISRQVAGPFLGYLTAQKQRLLGERGQKGVNRPELVAKYGYDTKYAMHMLRLGIQGCELLETGCLRLPMNHSDRAFLLGVRQGGITLDSALTEVGRLEQQLKDLERSSPLRDAPDTEAVEGWMRAAYMAAWTDGTR